MPTGDQPEDHSEEEADRLAAEVHFAERFPRLGTGSELFDLYQGLQADCHWPAGDPAGAERGRAAGPKMILFEHFYSLLSPLRADGGMSYEYDIEQANRIVAHAVSCVDDPTLREGLTGFRKSVRSAYLAEPEQHFQ